MNELILQTVKKKGLLLEKEVYEFLNELGEADLASELLEKVVQLSGQKLITKNLLTKNVEIVKSAVSKLEDERKRAVDTVCVKIGLSLEVSHEREVLNEKSVSNKDMEIKDSAKQKYQVFYADTTPYKKLEVSDFTGYFRSRYQQMQKILMSRRELNNLVSINKISSQRSVLSIIGILKEKRVTKNKNIILVFEDLTGEIGCLVRFDNAEVFAKAEELQLDDIVGVKASGNKDMLFVQDIIFPDSFLSTKVNFQEDISIAFLSDVHAGSRLHLKDEMEKFLQWLNSDSVDAKKIRYIFFVGDNVDGVGIFPGQEELLKEKTMVEQYRLLASYLKKVPREITMFMIPGQHDAVRVAEPQPIIGKRYAPDLYEIDNLVLLTNPAFVKLIEGEKEFKILLYHGASIHTFINEIKELRDLKAHLCPAKAVKHMLKRRHLAPMHSEVTYIPNSSSDPLLISEVPDIIATGEVHRLDVENYNGTLIITGSCWQSQTPFEEKIGNFPDPCKVPVFNLRSRELKIFDFGGKDD